MNFLDEFEQNEKNDKDDEKSSDSSIHSEPNQKDISLNTHEENLTSLNKTLTYLNFFIKIHHQSPTSVHPKHYEGFLQSQLAQLSHILDQQISEQIETQSDKNIQIPLNRKTHQFLSEYQESQKQNLEETILKSKRFKKTKTFTNELIIHEIHPSKHYEIVKLDIQLMWYKTEICLLNNLQRSSLKKFGKFSGLGASGEVYFMKVSDEQVAIKCIPFSRLKSNETDLKPLCKEMKEAIKEYFFLLLFSQLRVGPQTKTIGGFDMIINSDVIQFATQICEIPHHQNLSKMKKQLSESLFKMNMLNAVHRDIKPANILYSPEYKKHVFIDFGCSEALNEILGQITPTQFVGTTAFCSFQMLSLLSHKNGKVNLYFNDLVGLRKSLEKQWRTKIIPQRPNNQMNISFFELEHMKYLLYVGKFDEFEEAWSSIYYKKADQKEEIQMKLLQFFSQLKIGPDLRLFYWKEIDESIREMEQFKELKEMMKTNTVEILSEFITQVVKQEQFSFVRFFYQKLMIEQGDLTEKEKQIENIIESKQSIENYLANLTNKTKSNYESEQLFKNQLIKMSLVVALYTSFASNQYNTNIEDKVKACSVALEILEKQFQNQLLNVHLVFQSEMQSLIPMTRFHQYFIFHFWHFIPEKYKSKTQFHCIVTISLLGYPTNRQKMTFYLIGNSVLSKNHKKNKKKDDTTKQKGNIHQHEEQKISKCDKNIRRKSKDCSSSNKLKETQAGEDKQKLQRICWFWQGKLLTLIFGNVFYPKNSTKMRFNLEYSLFKQINTQLQKIMSFQGQTREVFFLNEKFFRTIILEYSNFNQNTYNQLFSLINLNSIRELEQDFYGVRRWRYLMRLVLCFFVLVFEIKNSGEILKHLYKEIIFYHQYKNTILPYGVCLLLHHTLNIRSQSQIISKLDNIINCFQVSFRFKIQRRLNIVFKEKDFKGISQLVVLLQKQMQISQFSMQNTPLLISILDSLQVFLSNYVNQLPKFRPQYFLLFKKCYGLVNLGIEIGYFNYNKHKKIFSADRSVSVEELDAKFIQNSLYNSRMLRSFYLVIINIGKIYQKNSKLKELQALSIQHELVLEQRHSQFLKKISQQKFILSITSQWVKLINEFPIIKNIIKQNRLLLIFFLKLCMKDMKSLKEVLKDEFVENFFESFEPKDFSSSKVSKVLPSFDIAFTYFQMKILETNYEIRYCQQLIQLYKICAERNEFFPIFEKPGLIRFLFNSHVYLQKGHQEILSLLSYMARNIKVLPKKERVEQFVFHLNTFFWCKCADCFPRFPKHWDPDGLTKLLYTRIRQFNIIENPYLSLVYFYSLSNDLNLQKKLLAKIVMLILRTIIYFTPQTQRMILSQLYYFVYVAFQSEVRNLFEKQNKIKIGSFISGFPKSQKNLRLHRRYLYYFCMINKHQTSDKVSIETLIHQRFRKETYFKNYKFPRLIKQIYYKKLHRYYDVKRGFYGQVIHHTQQQSKRNTIYEGLKNKSHKQNTIY